MIVGKSSKLGKCKYVHSWFSHSGSHNYMHVCTCTTCIINAERSPRAENTCKASDLAGQSKWPSVHTRDLIQSRSNFVGGHSFVENCTENGQWPPDNFYFQLWSPVVTRTLSPVFGCLVGEDIVREEVYPALARVATLALTVHANLRKYCTCVCVIRRRLELTLLPIRPFSV